jgi:AraC-like DNA-binding protein
MENAEHLTAVRRMQEYIGAHITEPITLLDLAHSANYSPFHTNRIFKRVTGKTPFEYIRKRRLSLAALKLRDNLENKETRVLDVALDFVFDSHEGFTRAFSKEFGITPHQYGKETPPLYLFIPDPVVTNHKNKEDLIMSKNTNTIFVQVIERPERKFLCKRAKTATEYFGYCDEVGCDVWGLLTSVKEALYEPVGAWMPENMRPEGTSEYVQGVELPKDYSGNVPDGFELVDLPACKLMVFQGQPYDDADFENAIDDMWEVMKNYKPEIYGFKFAPEDAPRIQLTPQGYRGYIEALPVRSVQ